MNNVNIIQLLTKINIIAKVEKIIDEFKYENLLVLFFVYNS